MPLSTDLVKSREHAEQFKSISKANEAALESLNATYEQFKSETERELRARGDCFKMSYNSWVRRNDFKLFKRISLPLAGSIMELTRQLEASRTEFENDKHMLEATIADLSTIFYCAMSTQASVQEDLHRQTQVSHKFSDAPPANLLYLGCA